MADYKLKIRRFDPESGRAAYWADHDVELPPERSVLDGILQVKDREDGSIGIRCSCRAAICGSCGVRINGKSALACNTRIGEAAESSARRGDHREPMGNMPVIKDLITDMEAVHWKKVRRVVPWLLPAEEPPEDSEYIVPAEAMLDVTQAMACIHAACACRPASRSRWTRSSWPRGAGQGLPLRGRPARRRARGAPQGPRRPTRTASTTAPTASPAWRSAPRTWRR